MVDWLDISKEAFDASTNYIDTNYRSQWEDNILHYQSKHARGSKYHTAAYKYRSKIFRPKTRSVVRGTEAAAVAAFFSNQDVVSIEPVNPNDMAQVFSAQINRELINIRLDRHIPWYMTCIGGVQDSQVIGVVCSIQEWLYEENEEGRVLEDRPNVRLIPIENLRIDPGADWIDPVSSSPFIIELMPMYWGDVKHKMRLGKWHKIDKNDVARASRHAYDTTKSTRNKDVEDPEETHSETLKEFDTVWVHRNIVRIYGEDYHYFTVGSEELLTDPVPLEDAFAHNERPFAIGVGAIEAHCLFPDSPVRMGFNLQQETNEVANQRSDNVKLVLNKRWKVRRGAQVDIKNLMRNVPGGVSLMNDPNTDVVGEQFQDVTSSAYMEQDRLNVDFDELMGSFSASTIQTNRKLNETVGGMEMLQGSANSMTEYNLRTVGETWLEKVFRQLVMLEQHYETDQTILALAADQAQVNPMDLYQHFGTDEITDWLLNQKLTTRVNVGQGATDPMGRVNKLLTAIQILSEIAQAPAPGLKFIEISKEVFAQLGYKDGKRFMEPMGENPQVQQMQQAIEQMQAEIENLNKQLKDKQDGLQTKLIQTQMKEEAETDRTEKEIAADIITTEMKIKGELERNLLNEAFSSR